MSKSSERGNKGLTQSFVDNAPIGRHLDKNGLYLVVKKVGQGSWEYREQRNGKRHQIGLGSSRKVKLAVARGLAAKARAAITEGRDPKAAIGKIKIEAPSNKWKLEAVFSRFYESKRPSLKGGGSAGRWASAMKNHVLPKLGKKSVEDITVEDVKETIASIWHSKPEVAQKAASVLGGTIKYSTAEGSSADLFVVAKAKELLGKQIVNAKHIKSTPYEDVPELYRRICELHVSPSTLALRLAILTVNRSTPVRQVMLSELDLEAGTWTVPAEKMKGLEGQTEDFICPITSEVLRIIQLAMPFSRDGKLFPSQTGKSFVSDVALTKLLNKLNEKGRVHGFRSSLGDWARAQGISETQIELCLQHVGVNKVARAYRRDPQVELRRDIMERWAQHVTSAVRNSKKANLKVVT